MPTSAQLSVLLSLQQVVLDSSDEQHLVKKLLDSSIDLLPKIGLDYYSISAIFTDEDKNVLSVHRVLKAGNLSLKVKENFLQFNSKIQNDLNENKLVILDKPEEIYQMDSPYPLKSVVISPMFLMGNLIGYLLLPSEISRNSISAEEQGFIENFSNFTALTFRLQNTQMSLTNITKDVYKMNVRLHDLDKLKDDFVSMASHELRTPMTAIKSYLWMALNKKKADLTPDLSRYLGRAYHSTERLISLVNDMLNISRIESGRIALRLAEVDPVALAHEIMIDVIPKATELKLTVRVEDKKVSKVLIDKDKIHEVIINLIGNALKFTKSGGIIVVTFEEKHPFVYISVTDSGVGMAKEDMERLFKKFSMIEHSYVAAAASGGTGLGLYISKSIANIHKGDITAYSPGQGKGSTFTLSVPIVGTSTALELKKEAPKVTEDSKALEKKKLSYI